MLRTTEGPVPVAAQDWNELWQARQTLRTAPRDTTYWDKRAQTFDRKDAPDTYAQRFLELADVHPGETVFDMGCGTGNLSVPLGQRGHEVLAADFSRVMLERLEENLQQAHVTSVRSMQLSWEDDWRADGVESNSFDVCVASRSIATDDLRSALLKLTDVARRRVCITLATGVSPRIDARLMRKLGIVLPENMDAVYALGILSAEGYLPQLTYINTKRFDAFATFDDAREHFTGMVDMALEEAISAPDRDEMLRRLHAWLEGALQKDDHGEGVSVRQPRDVNWAFMWWDK